MKTYIIAFVCAFTVLVPASAFGAVKPEEGTTISLQNPIGGTKADPKGMIDIAPLIGKIVQSVLGIVGAITLAVFVYGGFLWLTSGGNGDKISTGTSTMLWATVGIIVIFSSYAILSFVLDGIGSGDGTFADTTSPTGNAASDGSSGTTVPVGAVAPGGKVYTDGEQCKIETNDPQWVKSGLDLVGLKGYWNCQKSKGQNCDNPANPGQCQPLCRYLFTPGKTICQANPCEKGKSLTKKDLDAAKKKMNTNSISEKNLCVGASWHCCYQ